MASADPKERVLGKDYVILKGRGQRDIYNGATVEGDSFMHLGVSTDQTTACKEPIREFLLTCADVEIDCPQCIRAVQKKTS